MKKNKSTKVAVMTCIFVLVAILMALLLIKLFEPHETHTSDENTTTVVAALSCKSANMPEAFFHSEEASSEAQEVKITMQDNRADKVSFTYTGTFANAEEAKRAASDMHADYNIYMGTTTVGFSDLLPNFSTIDKQVVIALYLDEKTLAVGTAPLIFLSESEMKNFNTYSLNNLKKIYTGKGFSCVSTN